jgi:hypothetical protein
MADQKTLKSKTGIAQRLFKEFLSYQREETVERERYEKLKNEGAEETRLRQQQNVCDETSQMIPYCRNKLDAAYKDLQKVTAKITSDEEKQWEEYISAQDVIQEIDQAGIFTN